MLTHFVRLTHNIIYSLPAGQLNGHKLEQSESSTRRASTPPGEDGQHTFGGSSRLLGQGV